MIDKKTATETNATSTEGGAARDVSGVVGEGTHAQGYSDGDRINAADDMPSFSGKQMPVDEEEDLETLTSGFTIFQIACESKDKLRQTLVENFLNQAKNSDEEEKHVKLHIIGFLLYSLGFQRDEVNLEELAAILDDDNSESENSMRFLNALITAQQKKKRAKKVVKKKNKSQLRLA